MMRTNDRQRWGLRGAALVAVGFSACLHMVGAVALAQSAPSAEGPAPSSEPAWKSSPYHGVIGGDGRLIPCRCLFRGRAYQLGEKVCMQTHLGTVMTECDLQLNNTSWVPTNEACTTS